ncbi:MAG: group 1 truncated hemoglobin [Myxococcales bacterium]|nr:group 1 truncated hemoglobin [Myxococcales bacterium]
MSDESAYEQIGGEPQLRAIIDEFVERLFADIMIGFFFRNADKKRIKDKEFELAAAFLGGPQRYTGRPLRQAHAQHPIMGGQFARRKKLLEEVLIEKDVPRAIIGAWMAHTEDLRPQITGDPDGECNDS